LWLAGPETGGKKQGLNAGNPSQYGTNSMPFKFTALGKRQLLTCDLPPISNWESVWGLVNSIQLVSVLGLEFQGFPGNH
jgi:hypothetical protein